MSVSYRFLIDEIVELVPKNPEDEYDELIIHILQNNKFYIIERRTFDSAKWRSNVPNPAVWSLSDDFLSDYHVISHGVSYD